MKNKFLILLTILTVLSIAGVIGYMFYERAEASPKYPEIHFTDEIVDVPTNASDAQLLKGVTASDPEDGDVTSSLVVEGMSRINKNGNVKVSYIAFDSKNHMARAERIIHLTDYSAPKFELTSALCFRITNNIDVLSCVKANDMFDGDISRKVKYSIEGNSVSMNNAGEYEIELRVTNSLGDTAHLPLTVDVTQSNPNPANITLSQYLVYLEKGSEFNAKSYVVGYSADGGYKEGADGLRISGTVSTDDEGIYTVQYLYGSGSNASRTKLIVVVE